VGVNTTVKIMSRLHQEIERRRDLKPEDLQGLLKAHILELLGTDLEDEENNLTKPHVILVVGVNGVGKTTSIGKLAWRFKQAGKQVVLGAADTFRAAVG
jgi:fused signal recognition particle receptor